MTWDRERVQWAFTRAAIAGLCFAGASWLVVFYVLEPAFPVAPLGSVEWVEVSVRGEPSVLVTDRARVVALAAFAEEVREGWHDSWHTAPAAQLEVCYFRHLRGERMRYQCIGAGRRVLTIWGEEAWALQDVNEEQTRRFAALAGVAPTLLDRR